MKPNVLHSLLSALLLLLFSIISPAVSSAQSGDAQAFFGEPYGVGKIAVEITEANLPEPLGAEGLVLTERNNRVFYPTYDTPQFGKVLKEVLNADTPLTEGGPVRQHKSAVSWRGIAEKTPPHGRFISSSRDANRCN